VFFSADQRDGAGVPGRAGGLHGPESSQRCPDDD